MEAVIEGEREQGGGREKVAETERARLTDRRTDRRTDRQPNRHRQ